MSDWNDEVIAEFRENSGQIGGNFAGAPLLLLHTTGAKTGAERVSPMMYQATDDGWAVFASYAGKDINPAWYHNLKAHPDIELMDGEQPFRTSVRYRTVGDMSCTGAVESDAADLETVVDEIAATRITERGETRADDRVSEAAMEDRKVAGYF